MTTPNELKWIQKSEYDSTTGKYLYTIATSSGKPPLRISFEEEKNLSPQARATRELGHLMLLKAVHKEKSTEFKPGTKITLLTENKPLGETTKVQLHIKPPGQEKEITTKKQDLSALGAKHQQAGGTLLERIEKKRKALWPERSTVDVFKKKVEPSVVATAEAPPPAAAAPAAAARPIVNENDIEVVTPGASLKRAQEALRSAMDAANIATNSDATTEARQAAIQRAAAAAKEANRAASDIDDADATEKIEASRLARLAATEARRASGSTT